ncbi:unnamed protein product [Rotaria sordida]|uniref:Uncharacterized protein n=1 Tax=Rotaria sordida TaxID=392033 RepID=A0A814NIF4_9BILA|nr:unnamed protein product [Rotaria sordida]CAF3675935.1 unnamed protein product [Rotaria sordida]
MECSRCKHEISIEEYVSILKKHTDINLPLTFSPFFVLKNHEAFHAGILSLINKEKDLIFFDKDHHEKNKMNRPVLIQSLTFNYDNNEDHFDDSYRQNIYLIEMKMNHVYKDQQLSLWIVTRPESTNMIDGTIYMVVRDKFDFHIRLVISNWSYIIPTNEFKSTEKLSHIFDELLPVDSMIKLCDPLLTTCNIDGQPTLRCDAPNTELILSERQKKCFVLDKLDELRDRGNQAYIRGDIQIAIDYYTFAINRIIAMAGMVMSNNNDFEMNLFRNAFQRDLARLHSNRSACYLREHLYPGANLDSLVVVTEFTYVFDELFNLSQNSSINFNLRLKHTIDFNQIQTALPRLKHEYQHGEYDLKQMFNNESLDQIIFFDIHMFHSNFYNDSCIKKRNQNLYAKCCIPSGTLLLVQHAFTFVKSGINDERRLLNAIEKHLIMASNAWEFHLIRIIPCINEWFKNETDADENDYETYPKAIPWYLLVKTQKQNPFRSKSLVGWWPQASLFKVALDSKQKANCLWFICGKAIFIFNFMPIHKNDEFIIAHNNKINSFLKENQKQFTFLLRKKNQVQLDEIFYQLKKTQIYFDT